MLSDGGLLFWATLYLHRTRHLRNNSIKFTILRLLIDKQINMHHYGYITREHG